MFRRIYVDSRYAYALCIYIYIYTYIYIYIYSPAWAHTWLVLVCVLVLAPSDVVEEETVSFVLNNTEEGVGMCAQAKFKGGDIWYAGIVQDLHVDGTYHILYEDGDEEASVKRDMIEPVEVFSVDFPLFF